MQDGGRDVPNEKLGLWNPHTVHMSPYPTVRLAVGATIRFRSVDKPDTLRGPNLSGLWLDEGSLMDEAVFQIVIGCLREIEQGWLSCTATPKGMNHWTYDRFATGRPQTALFTFATKANPFLPPTFASTLAQQYIGVWAFQELGGLFVQMEGAEFPGHLLRRVAGGR